MTVIAYKRVVVILLIIVGVLLVCIWNLAWKSGMERMEARDAWRLIMNYESIRGHLSTMTIADTAANLDMTLHTGLNVKNSDISKIMERERKRMIKDTINDLREKTGEDLGDAPERWIEKYGSK